MVTTTEYVPEVATLILEVVCPPGDHKYVEPAEEVKVTEPPAQNVVGPPAVIVGVGGVVPMFTTTVFEFADEQVPLSR